MSRSRRNWDEVRAAYVEGHIPDTSKPFVRDWPTLPEIATLFGIRFATVEQRSGSEHWSDQREAFQADVEAARRRHVFEQRVEQSTRTDDRGLSNAEAGLGLVGMRLTYLLNGQAALAQNERGRGVDARELSALGLAGKRFLDMKAQILGQPLTAAEGASADAEEREARVADARLAEQLVAFIAERQAEDAEVEVPSEAVAEG